MTTTRSPVLALAARRLPAAPIILEAGSHDGSHTCALSATWPAARIYAIEPTPGSYAELAARALRNVACRRFALASENGTAAFYVDRSGDGGASSLLPAEPWFARDHVKHEETIEVATRTLTRGVAMRASAGSTSCGSTSRGWSCRRSGTARRF